jgi:hypothetical protein
MSSPSFEKVFDSKTRSTNANMWVLQKVKKKATEILQDSMNDDRYISLMFKQFSIITVRKLISDSFL